jgi:hypothetical protein
MDSTTQSRWPSLGWNLVILMPLALAIIVNITALGFGLHVFLRLQ